MASIVDVTVGRGVSVGGGSGVAVITTGKVGSSVFIIGAVAVSIGTVAGTVGEGGAMAADWQLIRLAGIKNAKTPESKNRLFMVITVFGYGM
jgi:hypothetical protein